MARSLVSLMIALTLILGVAAPVRGEGAEPYVVAPGDTLITIAQHFGSSVEDLMRLNGLSNPHRIRIGQQLLVPWRTAGGQGERIESASAGFHLVGPGETLEAIAAAYNLTVAELAEANQLADPDFLRIGEHLSLPTPSRSTVPTVDRWEVEPSFLEVPYRSQLDGSRWGDSNCGPATLAMLMAYFDEWWSSDGIRRDVNQRTGDWTTDGGSDWESLVFAAQKRGFSAESLYEAGSYRRWTFNDLAIELDGGHPPMLLVRYRDLPGHRNASWWGDHYIIVVGLTAEGHVAYHDSAFDGGDGAYRVMSQEQLMRAWGNNIAGIQYSAMVLRWLGPSE